VSTSEDFRRRNSPHDYIRLNMINKKKMTLSQRHSYDNPIGPYDDEPDNMEMSDFGTGRGTQDLASQATYNQYKKYKIDKVESEVKKMYTDLVTMVESNAQLIELRNISLEEKAVLDVASAAFFGGSGASGFGSGGASGNIGGGFGLGGNGNFSPSGGSASSRSTPSAGHYVGGQFSRGEGQHYSNPSGPQFGAGVTQVSQG
jgi:hypothetical protein